MDLEGTFSPWYLTLHLTVGETPIQSSNGTEARHMDVGSEPRCLMSFPPLHIFPFKIGLPKCRCPYRLHQLGMGEARFYFVDVENGLLATSPRNHALYNYLVISSSDSPSESLYISVPFNPSNPRDLFWPM